MSEKVLDVKDTLYAIPMFKMNTPVFPSFDRPLLVVEELSKVMLGISRYIIPYPLKN